MKRSRLPLVPMLLLAVLAAPLGALSGPLDGHKFSGETGEKGKAKGDPEDFVFAAGELDPLACHKYGFAKAPYQATEEGGAIRFVAEHTNAKGERMKWTGTVRGDLLEGTMQYWPKPGGKPSDYWFKAKKVQ